MKKELLSLPNYLFSAISSIGSSVALSLLVSLAGPSARAATISWANVGTNYSTGGNWTGGNAPADSLTTDIASFATATPTFQPNLDSDRSVAGVAFANGAGAFTFSGAGTLTLGASGIANNSPTTKTLSLPLKLGLNTAFSTNSNGALLISGSVDTNGLGLTLNGNGTGASSISGIIGGTGRVTKSDSATWSLSGANNFSGGVTLSAGTLALGHDSALGTGAFALNGGNLTSNATRILTNAVTLGGDAAIAGSQAITFRAPITLTGNRTLTVTNSALTTLDAGVSESGGSRAFTKAGAGNLLVRTTFGTTGTTTLSAGTLTLDTGVALPASNFVFTAGILATSGAFNRSLGAGAGQVQYGAGNVGFAAYNGALTVTFGGGEVWGSTPLFIQGSTLSLSSSVATNVVTLNSNFSLGSATRTITVADNTLLTTDSAIISGNLSGDGGLIKNGTGLLTLTGANSYTGPTQILAGSVAINSLGSIAAGPSALGNPSIGNGTITLGSGTNVTSLTYTGPATVSNRTINLGGTTGAITINASGTGALALTGGVTATGAGSKTLTLTGTNLNENEIGGAIVDNSGTNRTSISKTGTGTWKLSGANTYTGTTTLSQGTLIAGSDQAFGTGTLSITGAGTLRGDGTARVFANNVSLGITNAIIGGTSALTFNGTLTSTASSSIVLNITNTAPTIFNAVNLSNSSSNRTVTFAVSNAVSITGTIANGGTSTSSGITKTLAGTLTLSGANTYSGTTTITGGTIRASNTGLTSATGTGPITVSAAGTIAGTGRVTGALALNGTISPGGPAGSGPGTFSTGAQTWNGGGHYVWEIGNATGSAGTGWDNLTLTGGLTIAATNVNRFVIDIYSLTAGNTPGNAANFSGSSSYSWVIASVSTAISGFTGDRFTVNATNFSNPYTGTFSVTQSGGNLLLNYLAAVPEPAPFGALMGAAVLALALLRRRLPR